MTKHTAELVESITSSATNSNNAGSSSTATDITGERRLRITSTDKSYELHGLLTVKHTRSKSVWILCHGLCSSLFGTVPTFLAEKLDANTFRFDFAGCGQSGGDWKYAGYERERDDLRAVVLHLRQLEWIVDCVLGHSKGGAAVLHYGEKFDDVPLIVNVSSRFDMRETPRSRFTEEQWLKLAKLGSFVWTVKGSDYQVTQTDFDERAQLDMKRTASAIRSSTVLTIHGDEDKTIPVADAYKFEKLIHQHKLVVVKGGTHGFCSEAEQIAVIQALSPYLK